VTRIPSHTLFKHLLTVLLERISFYVNIAPPSGTIGKVLPSTNTMLAIFSMIYHLLLSLVRCI